MVSENERNKEKPRSVNLYRKGKRKRAVKSVTGQDVWRRSLGMENKTGMKVSSGKEKQETRSDLCGALEQRDTQLSDVNLEE